MFRMSLLAGLLFCAPVEGRDKSFSELVGNVKVGEVQSGEVLPFIVWGGESATFYANGGLETKPGSLFAKQNLKFTLKPGDDFIQQVRDYMSGKTPWLRSTFRMAYLASEVLNSDPRTKPVCVVQISWSAGDHIIGTSEVKNLNTLVEWVKKGRKPKIAIQECGPHVGMVDDMLKAAKLKWSDIEVIWCKDLTASQNSPVAKFRNGECDLASVITPDMMGCCIGIGDTGTGAEGTFKGSHVVLSTAQMSRSIGDFYFVRSDYYKSHREEVEKFAAVYLKAASEVVEFKKKWNGGEGNSPEYVNILKMIQDIYGKEVIPTTEGDAHGLIMDCSFVGLPGNINFFRNPGNLNGFEFKQKEALDLAVDLKYAKNRFGFEPAPWDYKKLATIAGIQYEEPIMQKAIVAETTGKFLEDVDDEHTILSFTIQFQSNQSNFSQETYGADFDRVAKMTSTFGNAVIQIRGHSDPTQTLRDFLKAGMEKGLIKRSGSKGNYNYTLRDKPLDFSQTKQIVDEIRSGNLSGGETDPVQTMNAALRLSQVRAQEVLDTIVEFTKSKGYSFDPSQVVPEGVGIAEPIIAKPSNMDEALKNMRVEFRLIRVPAEVLSEKDFDF